MPEYIERDTLIAKILVIRPSGVFTEAFKHLVLKIISEQPIADVQEVRHGKWILLNECANEGIYCSACHKKVYQTDYANQKLKSNYCPNCGAKMDEE